MAKRVLSCLFIIVLMTIHGFSQDFKTSKRLKIGIQTGFNCAWLQRFGPYKEDLKYFSNFVRLRGGASVFVAYQLTPSLRLQTGIGYANYGGQYREVAETVISKPSAGSNGKSTSTTYFFADIYKMDFIEIPIMVKAFLLPKKQISPYFTAGLSYGFLVRATNSYNFNDYSTFEQDDITPYVNKYAVNGILGLGVEFFKRRRISFGLDLKFHNSFTKVFTEDKMDYAYPDEDDPNVEYLVTYDMETYYYNVFCNVFSSVNF